MKEQRDDQAYDQPHNQPHHVADHPPINHPPINHPPINLDTDLFGLRLSRATQSLRRYLVVQPPPDALATAQAALVPLLWACGQDVWHPHTLRHLELPSAERVRYRLELSVGAVRIDMYAVATDFTRTPVQSDIPTGATLGVRSNGRDWQLFDLGTATPRSLTPRSLDVSLFAPHFGSTFYSLFQAASTTPLHERFEEARVAERQAQVMGALGVLIRCLGAEVVQKHAESAAQLVKLARVHGLEAVANLLERDDASLPRALDSTLRALEAGLLPPVTFSPITLTDVQRHCRGVRHLKGQLVASFDDTPIAATSRSGLYVVLAALAVQVGRLDAVPADDLIQPPEAPPEGRHCRPLGYPGYFLALDGDAGALEGAVAGLLDSLNLRHRLSATMRGQPFPAG